MKVLRGLFLWACVLAVVLPLLWVVLGSFKPSLQVIADPWGLPSPFKPQNYREAWTEAAIGTGFLNSLIVTLTTLLILLPIGAMASYVLARFKFWGRTFIANTFLAGMMFPVFLVMIPLFLLMRTLGLTNSLGGLIIVYVAYSLSFTIFVLQGFFQAIPVELEEASLLDGCSESALFWRVMLPIAKPGLIVVGIFNAIGLWNEYGLALVLMTEKSQRTLPLAIADLSQTQQYQADYGALFAALVIVMVPLLILYWFIKDRLKESMLAGSLKG